MALKVRVDRVSKQYLLGNFGYGTLRHDLQSWWARLRGKSDPNAKIDGASMGEINAEFWALKEVSFRLNEGERLGIVGRNGSGKSTMLKILSRLTAPTEGSVRLRGRVASLLEVGTGFHPELTGLENIYLNGAILGMRRWEIRAKLDEIIEFSEVEQFIKTPVKRYSSGMFVRLAFAVAAHLDSDILLLDEVLAVGDAAFQAKCLSKVMEVSTKGGKTVVFISHNQAQIEALCNRALLLDHGTLRMDGTVNDVMKEYNQLLSL
jgi:lipopolysaccharide transport system ATP-binding protein